MIPSPKEKRKRKERELFTLNFEAASLFNNPKVPKAIQKSKGKPAKKSKVATASEDNRPGSITKRLVAETSHLSIEAYESEAARDPISSLQMKNMKNEVESGQLTKTSLYGPIYGPSHRSKVPEFYAVRDDYDELELLHDSSIRGTELPATVAITPHDTAAKIYGRVEEIPLPSISPEVFESSLRDDKPFCRSIRFDFYPPHESRDTGMHAIYNDESTMHPWLSELCPMSLNAMRDRRESQRKALLEGTSCFLDIVDRHSGSLVGSSGFRSFHMKEEMREPVHNIRTAEWGIIVSSQWQRKGVCAETFACTITFAGDRLNMEQFEAKTSNETLSSFLLKRNMKMEEVEESVWKDGKLQCIEFSAKFQDIVYGLDGVSWKFDDMNHCLHRLSNLCTDSDGSVPYKGNTKRKGVLYSLDRNEEGYAVLYIEKTPNSSISSKSKNKRKGKSGGDRNTDDSSGQFAHWTSRVHPKYITLCNDVSLSTDQVNLIRAITQEYY